MTPALRQVRPLLRVAMPVAVTAALVALAIINIAVVKTWHGEPDDGVWWQAQGIELVAQDVARDGPAARSGVQTGDVLLQIIDGREPREVKSREDVIAALHDAEDGRPLQYVIVRQTAEQPLTLVVHPERREPLGLYYSLALVGMLSIVVGASVHLRRPMDPATLHFFWLTVAFFGVLSFHPAGVYNRLDYVFDWSDAVARLALPPLFLHFALKFPDRVHPWIRTTTGRTFVTVLYLPAVIVGLWRVRLYTSGLHGPGSSLELERIEWFNYAYLTLCLFGGLVIMVRALRRLRSVTARRQLRWIVWGSSLGAVPFLLLYVGPLLFGRPPAFAGYTAVLLGCIPLAFASAIVRYRLMDVEVIIKRVLVMSAVVLALAIVYETTFRLGRFVFGIDPARSSNWALLSTLIVALLAPWMRQAIQSGLDRLYYKDHYDYRRALVTFTRELNSDLDLTRLTERLVSRIQETLGVEKIAVFQLEATAAPDPCYSVVAATGFDVTGGPGLQTGPVKGGPGLQTGPTIPPIQLSSPLGARLAAGHAAVLDDPTPARRYGGDDAPVWRDVGLYHFIPCVSKETTIAVIAAGQRPYNEPLSSEDTVLLGAVAGQAATALENARLYGQLSDKADEIERLRQFSDSVVESLSDGLVVLDLDDGVLRWNRRAETLTGIMRDRAAGRRLAELFSRTFVDAIEAARRESPSGAALYRVALEAEQADAPRLVNLAIAPFQTEGRQAGWILVIEDVTERASLEEQLRLSEKMAAIGLLAAGVAHEVNTPLTGISSYTQMLLQRSAPEDPNTQLLEKIERQTFRAAKIVNSLLNLARPSGGEMTAVDLHTVIGDILSLLEHQFKVAHIQVRRELDQSPAVVRGVEYKLQQVFLNLFLNARDAMPKGGWLTVATRVEESDAVVEVSDTGQGIPAELLARIYDPFFTTKSEAQGTGLGLSVTYGIVREHNGTLTCESEVGKGTCFRLTLPRHQGDDGVRRRARRPATSGTLADGGCLVEAPSLLVIDDEEIIRDALSALLTGAGYEVATAATGQDGIDAVTRQSFDAVLLDLMLPDKNGLEVLDEIRKHDDELPVVMITAFATIESAVAATKQGAFYYFTKPFKHDEVLAVLRNATERRRLVRENRVLRDRLRSGSSRFDEIVGGSPRMKSVYDLISRAAPSRTTVLIQGESGTGKELVARAFHKHSARSDRAFVPVNTGSLPSDLLESNLFGHVKGAFTGAVNLKKGLFELADKGTIFFDEIGNVPLDTQAKLLRVIQEREFMRLGGLDTIKVDVRIIAATNADLAELMKAGKFREDLYYRLNVITVTLPPLRDRKDDIPLLVQHFLEKYGDESRKPGLIVTPAALDRLMSYSWPGNVRELENAIERAVVLCGGREIDVDLIPDHVAAVPPAVVPDVVIPPGGLDFRQVIIGHERRYIEAALDAANGVQKKAAELLNIKATTLNEMMKRYEIKPRRVSSAE